MARLSISLLGPLNVTMDGRPADKFEYNKVRALLAYLVVESGHPHRRDALAGLLWPDQSQKAALDSLRNALAKLRHAIGDQEADPTYLFITNEAIQFNRASDHNLDLAQFTNLLAAAKTHTHRHLESCKSCTERLNQASELYQGDFLHGFSMPDSDLFEDWLRTRRQKYLTQAIDVFQQLALNYETRGEYKQAMPYAQRVLELDPYHEQTHRQVMKLLASQEMCSEACLHYEKFRKFLDAELGVQPANETTHLYEQIKYGVFHPARAPEDLRFNNLPASLTTFVGRQRELSEIDALLDDPSCRLLTLVGPGGVGKTRLAVAVAAHQIDVFRHGACFIQLEALTSADHLVQTILESLNLTPALQGDLLKQLVNALQDKEMILVLDNFEHLLEGASLIADILLKVPGVLMLVTSRQRLGLQAEWLFEVNGLNYPTYKDQRNLAAFDAVQLFIARLHQVMPKVTQFDHDLPDVARVCEMVEGLPLGIELAAAATRLRSIDKVATALENGKEDLAIAYTDIPDRHRSLRAVFEHSWNLLTEQERKIFPGLAVFLGGFTQEAATQITIASPEVLTSLVEHCMIRYNPKNQRYDLHELIRQYALEKLISQGIEPTLRQRHLEYFIDMAEKAEAYHEKTERTEAYGILFPEMDNFRGALAWCFDNNQWSQAQQLAGALGFYWGSTLGNLREADEWMQKILQFGASLPHDESYARMLMRAGRFAQIRDFGLGVKLSEQALSIWSELGNQLQIALTLADLGKLRMRAGDLEEAKKALDESLHILIDMDDQVHQANVLLLLGIYYDTVDPQKYLDLIRNSFMQSLKISRAFGLDLLAARSIGNLGNIEASLENYNQARTMFEDSLKIIENNDNPELLHWMNLCLGDVYIHLENYSVAETYLEKAVEIGHNRGRESLDALSCLSYLYCLKGPIDQALYYFKEVFRQITSTHNVTYPWVPMIRMIGVLLSCGEPERATKLFSFNQVALEDIKDSLTRRDQDEYNQLLSSARAQLGEAAFINAWEEGRGFSVEQAKECALGAKVRVNPEAG